MCSNKKQVELIRALAKKKGWSMTFLASKLGLKASYFTDVKNNKTSISEKRLTEIANLLDTTLEYLNGETDDSKQKTPPIDIDRERSEEMKEIMRLYDAAPPQVRKAALALLESFVNGEDDQDRTDS